jgi:predicted permease
MRRFPGLRRLMRIDRGVDGVGRDVDEELAFHFDRTVAELCSNGLDAEAARREAQYRFGDAARVRTTLVAIDRARANQERRADWWRAAAQDANYALRGFRRRPGFTLAIVVTLGLGIGANAMMFGVVDRLLFRPPAHLTAPDRVHKIYFSTWSNGRESIRDNTSYARYLDVARLSRSMEQVVAYSDWSLAAGEGEATREVDVSVTSANAWQLFDVRPALGRFYTTDDDRADNPTRVVVLSYSFWQSQFGGASDVIGQSMRLDAEKYTIIGVAPRHFTGLRATEPAVFIPMARLATEMLGDLKGTPRQYEITMLSIYAQRRPDVSVAAATADLTEVFRQSYRLQFPAEADSVTQRHRPTAFAGSVIEQRGPHTSANTRVAIWLLGVASIVMIIACANVGNLLLGRALRRRREIAVRLALGIGRARLIGQMLVETAMLAAFGAVAGVAIAQLGGVTLLGMLFPGLPVVNSVTDQRILTFAAACSIAAAILAGLAPALQARREDVALSLKNGSQGSGTARSLMRDALVVAQAALSVSLLVGAGLFVRSMVNVRRVDLGYAADQLLAIQLRSRGVTLDSAARAGLRTTLLERARANPHVANATLAVTVPFFFTSSNATFVDTDRGTRQVDYALKQIAAPPYFATTGTAIRRGRGVSDDDVATTSPVVIVSEEFARRAWPGQDALGKCVRLVADTMPCREVVGIAADVHMISRPGGEPDPMYYLPATQNYAPNASLLIRVRGPAAQYADAIRRDLQGAMPGISFVVATPISSTLDPVIRSWRLGATMFVLFGALALVLAAFGLYSVVAYRVAQRTHEIGVRMALGARAHDIARLVIGDGLRPVLLGMTFGIVVSFGAARWIGPLLFGVAPTDSLVMVSVCGVLATMALGASAGPALRASRVDPNVALRAD